MISRMHAVKFLFLVLLSSFFLVTPSYADLKTLGQEMITAETLRATPNSLVRSDSLNTPIENPSSSSLQFLAQSQPLTTARDWHDQVQLTLNGGAEYTATQHLQIELEGFTAEDGLEMSYAINTRERSRFSAWQPASSELSVELDAWYGANYINVILRDQTGREKWLWKKIVLDPFKPWGKIKVGKPAQVYTNTRDVTVHLEFDDQHTGVESMSYSINSTRDEDFSAWIPVASQLDLQLPNWQGANYINVKIRDKAGNVRKLWTSVHLDTAPPSSSFRVDGRNGGLVWSVSRNVMMRFIPSDSGGSGVDGYSYAINSNREADYSEWRSFAKLREEIELPAREGYHTVYYRVRDKAGNIREYSQRMLYSPYSAIATLSPEDLTILPAVTPSSSPLALPLPTLVSPTGAEGSMESTAEGLRFTYHVGVNAHAWAGAGLSYDDFSTEEVESGDWSSFERWTFATRGYNGNMKIEFIDAFDQKQTLYLSGMRPYEELQFRSIRTEALTEIDISRIKLIYFIAEGDYNRGTLDIIYRTPFLNLSSSGRRKLSLFWHLS